MVEMWIGISRDEIQRMKENMDSWVTNRWPLLEIDMRRYECLTWFEEKYPGKSLVKSACVGCPFHNDHEWSAIKNSYPEEFADACYIDDKLRNTEGALRGKRFLHAQRKPLRDVNLNAAKELGQGELFQDLMQNECDGMCGV